MRSRALALAVLVAALPSPARALPVCQPAPITIPSIGAASPYPSTITITAPPTTGAAWVEVQIFGFTHSFAANVGIVLVGPNGNALAIQDGPGNGASMSNVSYTISDAGSAYLPQVGAWTAGTYRPTAYFHDNFPAPGPGTTYANPGPSGGGTGSFGGSFGDLSTVFSGTWSLYVYDFITGDVGSIANGWCLTMYTADPPKGDLSGDQQADLLFQQQSAPGHHEAWAMSNGARQGLQVGVSPDAAATQQLVGVDQFVPATTSNDLVFWDSLTGQVEFWPMNGFTRSGSAIPLTGASALPLNWRIVATGDFNADDKPDLLWRNSTSQNLVIWTMDGTVKTGVLTPNPAQAVHSNWRVVAALDYNGDGNRDLLWYNDTSGKIVFWYMDASVVRTSSAFAIPDSAGNANWKVVAGGDYGAGPGGPPFSNDIVWRNQTSGKLVIWRMNYMGARVGAGIFTNPDAPLIPLDFDVVGPK